MSLFHREPKMVEAASESGNFNTLVKSVKDTDMVGALDGPGPLTLFAPTDEAFRKLPKGTVEQLMNDRAAMKRVLQHHVVSGKVMAKDTLKTHSVRALDGNELKIDTCDGITVDGAKVVQSDIMVRNGVMHAIDTVLVPGMAGAMAGSTDVRTSEAMGTERGMGAKAAAGAGAVTGAGAATVGATKSKVTGEKTSGTAQATTSERTMEGTTTKEKISGAGAATAGAVGSSATTMKEKTTQTVKDPTGAVKGSAGTVKETVTTTTEKVPGGQKVTGAGAAVAGGAGATAAATKEKIPGMGGKDVSKSMDEQMNKLQSMRDSGQISEAEFQAKKKDLMSGKM